MNEGEKRCLLSGVVLGTSVCGGTSGTTGARSTRATAGLGLVTLLLDSDLLSGQNHASRLVGSERSLE